MFCSPFPASHYKINSTYNKKMQLSTHDIKNNSDRTLHCGFQRHCYGYRENIIIFNLIHFWEGLQHRKRKSLIGVEMLLICKQVVILFTISILSLFKNQNPRLIALTLYLLIALFLKPSTKSCIRLCIPR